MDILDDERICECGKKMQVVYDFIDHVGLDFMDGVEAIACDMNSDFQEAFEEKCPWIQPVFDYFHIIKNFNGKVISEIRKDEDAASERIIHKGSRLFKTEDIKRKAGNEEKYDALLKENELLFTVDLIKEKLSYAYTLTDEAKMAEAISDIMDICESTGNKHLHWFYKLLDSHFEGIIAHATYKISSGKIEGINQKIKTLRRHGYGYPDDEYFFLKLMDISRKRYFKNQASHKILD